MRLGRTYLHTWNNRILTGWYCSVGMRMCLLYSHLIYPCVNIFYVKEKWEVQPHCLLIHVNVFVCRSIHTWEQACVHVWQYSKEICKKQCWSTTTTALPKTKSSRYPCVVMTPSASPSVPISLSSQVTLRLAEGRGHRGRATTKPLWRWPTPVLDFTLCPGSWLGEQRWERNP